MYPTYELAQARMTEFLREAEQARRARTLAGAGAGRQTNRRIGRRGRRNAPVVRLPRPRGEGSGHSARAA